MNEEEQQAWVEDVKRRHGIRCIGDEEEPPAAGPEQPAQPEGVSPYQEMALSPLYVSPDCVNFYEVPEGMSVTEFMASLP